MEIFRGQSACFPGVPIARSWRYLPEGIETTEGIQRKKGEEESNPVRAFIRNVLDLDRALFLKILKICRSMCCSLLFDSNTNL